MATLYSPDGQKYETNSKVEQTRLVAAHGYTVAAAPAPKKSTDAGKSDDRKS